MVTKLIDQGVDVNFDICYRPCMVPFPEIPKQDFRVPKLVNLQQQLYLLVDFSSFYGKLHDLVTLSSLFSNSNQRRLQFMQVLNHQICKQRATRTIITFKMGYNYDHLSSLCTFVAHTCAISGEKVTKLPILSIFGSKMRSRAALENFQASITDQLISVSNVCKLVIVF